MKDTDTITAHRLRGRLMDLCTWSRDGEVHFTAKGTKSLVEQIFDGQDTIKSYTREEIAEALTQVGKVYIDSTGLNALVQKMEQNRDPDIFLPERVYRHKDTGIYLFRTQKREWQVFGLTQTVNGKLYAPGDLELMP